MISNKFIQRFLLTVRVIHAAYLSSVLTAVLILVLFQILDFIPVFLSNDTTLVLAEIILGVFSLLCLTLGFIWPRLAKWYRKTKRNDVDVLFGHLIIRLSLFESVVIIGFILGLMGSGWLIVLPFFILAGAALLLTFPTKRRWAEWQRGKEPSTKGD